jgi:hypothetical protein
MTITKNLLVAALLSTVAAVSFAQTPAVVKVPATQTATVAAASAPAAAASKPAAKKKSHSKKTVKPMAEVTK